MGHAFRSRLFAGLLFPSIALSLHGCGDDSEEPARSDAPPASDSQPPAPVDSVVFASSGPDQRAVVGDTVMFNGSDSFASDDRTLSYTWRLVEQPAGSDAELASSMSEEPSLLLDAAGDYEIELVVSDGVRNSTPDVVEVVAIAAASGTGRTLPLIANDLVADPLRGLLYASVPSTSTFSGAGNSVAAIDPETATVTEAVFVGSEPGPLAITDDGQYLYVGISGSLEIRRIDLATFEAEPPFAIPQGRFGDPRSATRLATLAGKPEIVVVSTSIARRSPGFAGVVVFDSGVALPNETPDFSGASELVGGRDNTLYGYNNRTTGFEFQVLTVDENGIAVDSEVSGLLGRGDTRIIYAGDTVIATTGEVIDVSGSSPRLAGTFATSGPVAADARRAYYLDDERTFGEYVLRSFNRDSFLVEGEESLFAIFRTQIVGEPQGLIRWGTRGLAFWSLDGFDDPPSSGQVYILTSDRVEPRQGEERL
ncbi:MAG: hypothetical protein AAF735_03895 [Myxococcota bacterium]